MKNIYKIAIGVGIFALVLLIGFGINTAIVWGVCKIMGWTFSWKWVILFTIVYAVLKSIFSNNDSK